MKLPLQALLYILPVLPSIYALPSSRSERAARRINRRLASNSNDANRIERPTRAIASDIASPVSDAAITYTTDTAGAFYDEAAVRNTLELDVVIFALIQVVLPCTGNVQLYYWNFHDSYLQIRQRKGHYKHLVGHRW